jgi:hypothetical protein
MESFQDRILYSALIYGEASVRIENECLVVSLRWPPVTDSLEPFDEINGVGITSTDPNDRPIDSP